MPTDDKLELHLPTEHRRAHLSLRWLLIILASYLTLFSYLSQPNFLLVFVYVLAFTFSNIAISLIPGRSFELPNVQKVIAGMDLVFVSGAFYLLRGPETYLYVALLAVFVLALLWRDLRLVLFSLFVVSLLYGTFVYFRLFRSQVDVDIERFLTLALFFVVSVFYIFLSDRLKDNAKLSAALLEENRNAEVMSHITRALSSSLKSDEVLLAVVSRLCEMLRAAECSVIRLDSERQTGQMLVQSSDPQLRNVEIDVNEYPAVQTAYKDRALVFIPNDEKHKGIIAAPMIAQDAILGVICVRSAPLRQLSDANHRFFEVLASTAANALRNAQLFEEVEHRARTDYLTGLPNHRFFQSTLSVEFGRAQRHNHTLSLLIIDLDFLKEVNDRFGHPSGDLVIRTVAETIRTSCREIDFAARYGGEEFTVILPETPLPGAVQVADRIRERIGAEQFSGIGNITASIGVSNFPINALTKEDLIRVADQALYVAKKGGRDRVAYFNYQMITR